MDDFLKVVQAAMVAKGWNPAAATAQIAYDPDHLFELRDEGMTADEVAAQVERQYATNLKSA